LVHSHAANAGKAAALRTGVQLALALSPQPQAIVTIDADGQHDPADIPRFLDAVAEADLAIGCRARGGTSMPVVRRMANGLSTRAISWCAGQPIRDAQCGMRAIRVPLLATVPLAGERYAAETAFVIRAARAGARIREVEIATRYGPASHFRPLRDAAHIVATIWSLRPSTFRACASSAPTTTASSPTASTAWSAQPSRSAR
jgi:glycosyltransferase involved in cell wall biosynthesis